MRMSFYSFNLGQLDYTVVGTVTGTCLTSKKNQINVNKCSYNFIILTKNKKCFFNYLENKLH